MTNKQTQQRIQELRQRIRKADREYYVEANPTIADSEYDALFSELIELETQHPDLITPDSPTQRVGGEPIDEFRSVEHTTPMLSIDNTYNEGNLRAWVKRIYDGLKLAPPDENETTEEPTLFQGQSEVVRFTVDPKIDGIAVSLRYENGHLIRALTRGDGQRGDDILNNAKRIRSIPLTLEGEDIPPVLEVRGEVYMPKSVFTKINEQQAENDQPLFANPRNMTAGTLKSLDPKVTAKRGLRFTTHGFGQYETTDQTPESHSQLIETIRQLGLPAWECQICYTINEILAFIEEFDTKRNDLDLPTDGVVIRVDSLAQQKQLGSTSKSPRWCIAYKYPAEQATTKLTHVDWQIGKGGTLTPRATLDEVFISGTNVRHATLHNIEEIERKDIRINDTVFVEKAGEIIPQVIKVVQEKRTKDSTPIKPPTECPVCHATTERDGPKLYCTNPECPGQISEKLKWFVARGQMDIENLGGKTIDRIRATTGKDRIPLDHFADIFKLHEYREQLRLIKDDYERKQKDGSKKTFTRHMGDKEIQNLFESVEQAKDRGLRRLLAALGIPQIGSSMATLIAKRVKDMDTLLSASKEEVCTWVIECQGPSYRALKEKASKFYRALHSMKGRCLVNEARLHETEKGKNAKAALESLLMLFPKGCGVDWGHKKINGESRLRTDQGYKGILLREFSGIDELLEADEKVILRVFHDSIAGKILYRYLHSPNGMEAIRLLTSVGVDMTSREYAPLNQDVTEYKSTPFAGKTIVLTGKLESYRRAELARILEHMGAHIANSVSHKTDLVIAATNTGTKYERAMDLGIEIWDEDTLHSNLRRAKHD